MPLYGDRDSETVDEDNVTHAKVIETGVTKSMRLEYIPFCQLQGAPPKTFQSIIDFPDRNVRLKSNMAWPGR